jgi:hypothetical protein
MDRMTRDRDDRLPPELGAAMKALDARAAARAARLDVEAVAAGVLDRLRREQATGIRRLRWLSPGALRVAAAVVVLVAAGAVVTSRLERPQQTASMQLPVTIPAADSLDSSQLEAVLQAAGEVRPAVDSITPVAGRGSLDGLSEQELETLLASLKGAES